MIYNYQQYQNDKVIDNQVLRIISRSYLKVKGHYLFIYVYLNLYHKLMLNCVFPMLCGVLLNNM